MTTRETWQAIQRHLGIVPDGDAGALTARAVFDALNLQETPATTKWPRDNDAELRAFYGAPGTNHVQIIPPYQLYYEFKPVAKITVHEKIAGAVLEALNKVKKHYSPEDISRLHFNRYDGCFNNRVRRGGTRLSVHAYAAALDFDAAHNTLHQDHTTAFFAREECIPWFEIWESVGATSLGRKWDKDWMHTQFANL